MQLIVDPQIARFSRSDLVAEMQERFGQFTERTFRDWQEKGLIAAPRHEGRWRKGSSGSREALWSGHDRLMLIALLEKRDEHRQGGSGQLQQSELANLVVWSWAFWDGVVALDQAKRALATWAEPQIAGVNGAMRSQGALSRRVRQQINQVAAPGVSVRARRSLTAKMVDALWTDDLDGLRSLEADLTELVDPEQNGRKVGAPGASIDARGEIERLVRGHLAASAIVTGEPQIQNKHWFAAQRSMRDSWAEYTRDWMTLRTTSSTPDLFGPPELQLQAMSCSSTLLYILGSLIDLDVAAGSDRFAI